MFSCFSQFLELCAFLGFWPHLTSSKSAANIFSIFPFLSFCHQIAFSDLHPFSSIYQDSCGCIGPSHIVQNIFLNLTSPKSFFPCKVTQSQVPRIKMQASWRAIRLSTADPQIFMSTCHIRQSHFKILQILKTLQHHLKSKISSKSKGANPIRKHFIWSQNTMMRQAQNNSFQCLSSKRRWGNEKKKRSPALSNFCWEIVSNWASDIRFKA